jgi:hypothetical protein
MNKVCDNCSIKKSDGTCIYEKENKYPYWAHTCPNWKGKENEVAKLMIKSMFSIK